MPLLQKGIALAAGRMPKIIKPQAHAILDYLVAGSFFVAAGLCWRRNKRAALSSLICGGITTVNSALTDYPGGVWKLMTFQTHGKLDTGLAALTAMTPRLMGFDGELEAKFFATQSMIETTVIAMTDFDYYERSASGRRKQPDGEEVA